MSDPINHDALRRICAWDMSERRNGRVRRTVHAGRTWPGLVVALLDELATARADLARVTGERDEARALACDADAVSIRALRTERAAAIARAEAAERERFALHTGNVLLTGQRDHWRSVAESRPAITAEDCAAGPWAVVGGWDLASNNAAARIEDAIEAHAAKVPR
jgi:hypothetical protein